eukprot:CAMPEP_0181360396 /NCGR_PEP_ID=MMETSP1106-20121128/6642_1 /TAXON_ID=81844 /ORGANISM="Mantoniella antarctica, Strain SL-175" /LENGTH=64 /DNA_ID=CAMNT_0023473663 /DNA_START=116 /DNA_END=310 /DNA_ORIENTATION=+
MTSQERRLKAVRQLLLLVEDLGVLEGADDRKDAEESDVFPAPDLLAHDVPPIFEEATHDTNLHG